MFAEYVGLAQDVASHIESRRERRSETKSDILRRVLGVGPEATPVAENSAPVDFGQGVHLTVGERLFLYLSKPNNEGQKPDGVADVRPDGLYLDGQKVTPSRGSSIAPAMQAVQARLNHVNGHGKLVSLSAYRQWHVVRDGKMVSLDQLKDPNQRRHRTPKASTVDVAALLAELGITNL